jgi:hypothetical protein
MNPIDEAFEYGSWKADGHPLLVEYSRSVLDSIGVAVTAAFQRGSGVGAETGGVLFGRHGAEFVRIQAWRPLPLEQADASRLALGPMDELNLQRLIQSASTDPKLRGLVPVGWTQSTLRRSIALLDAPLEIYKRFFREPWQVVLMIRPSFQRPTMAGFFFRETDGTLRSEVCYREFLLLPPNNASTAVSPEQIVVTEPAPRFQEVPLPETAPPAPFSAGATRGHRLRWVLLTILALLVVAGGIAALTRVLPKTPVSALKVTEINNQLRIEWDMSSEVLRETKSATLTISDDGSKTEKILLPEELRGGTFTYQRSGVDVSVRMMFLQPGKPGVLQATRFLGQPLAQSIELQELRRKTASLQESLDSAKEDVRFERTRAKNLEDRLLRRRGTDLTADSQKK